MKVRTLLLTLITALLLTSCTSPSVGDVGVSQSFFAMDTVMSITLLDGSEEDLTAAVLEVNALDAILSRTRVDSPLSQVNEAAGTGTLTAVPEELSSVVTAALALAQRTGGAFDPTVAPLVSLWGFGSEQPARPSDAAISSIVPDLVGYQKVSCIETDDGCGILLAQSGMALDLGGIGKGYAADRMTALLRERGVTSALLSLGGNITALGCKEDGSAWQVAVRDPQDENAYLGLLPLSEQTVSTSGGYERYFEADGIRYHHILDPATGYPANGDLLSVTVVADEGATADALSTALFVLGSQAAADHWRASNDFECILVCTDGTVLVTEGLESTFEFWGYDHGYTCEILRR